MREAAALKMHTLWDCAPGRPRRQMFGFPTNYTRLVYERVVRSFLRDETEVGKEMGCRVRGKAAAMYRRGEASRTDCSACQTSRTRERVLYTYYIHTRTIFI